MNRTKILDMSERNISRRNLLGLAATAGLATALPTSAGAVLRRGAKRPKNIIYCVSDGMSTGVPSMLDQYMRRIEGKKNSVWMSLLQDPRVSKALMDTRSLSSLVTDSAAASTAWSSGSYCWNGAINTLPDGTELLPILPLLRERAKMKIGVVTTATVTHATPAGWLISIAKRGSEKDIAELYLATGADVLMGGGSAFFSPELIEKYKKAGYAHATDRAELSAAKGPVLGLFSKSHVPYEVDRRASYSLQKTLPSLREMTEKALSILKGSPNGFALQVEGARIDHAAHLNDSAGLIFDQMAFEDALQAVLQFAEEDGETLVIVTSDHGNSNPGLIGSGDGYFDSTEGLDSVPEMRASYEVLMPQLMEMGDRPNDVQGLIESQLKAKLTKEELSLVMEAITNTSPLKTIEQYQILGSALGIALSNHSHICWSGRQHSSDYTIMSAMGPGSELFSGLIKNIDVQRKLTALRGIEFVNPSMTWEAAHTYMKARAEKFAPVDPHWLAI